MTHTRKSRGGVRESLPRTKDASVFAAASDTGNTSLVGLLAVKRGHGIMCFDAVAAFGRDRADLYRGSCRAQSKSCLTCAVVMPESERWQTERSESGGRTAIEGVPRSFKAESEVPDDLLLERVRDCIRPACRGRLCDRCSRKDDGGVRTSRDQNVFETLTIIGVGSSFEHVGALRVIDEEGMWVKELVRSSVLTMMQMKDCRPSTSPKLEKQAEPGDDDPCEHPEPYRSAVCTILHMTKRRPDLQATARWLCKRLRDPNQKSWRQLVKVVRYIKGSRDLAAFHAESRQAGQHRGLPRWRLGLRRHGQEVSIWMMDADCIATAGRLDSCAQQWRERNHEHERVVEGSQINAMQS